MQTLTAAVTTPQIYRPRALAARLGISQATIWRMRQRGEFPAPIRLSPGACGWRADVIDAWLASREQRVIAAPTPAPVAAADTPAETPE